MAVLLQTFRLFDALGAPLTGASPSFRVYCDGTGADVLPHPTITPIAIGKYGFLFDDGAAVRVWQVNGGSLAVPRYVTGGNNGDVQVFGTYNVLGAPAAPGGGSPNFLLYADAADTAKTPPSILNPATGLFFFLPTLTDIDEARAFVIRSDSGGLLVPASYDGTVGNIPEGGGGGGQPIVQNVDPTPGTPINATQILKLDIIDTGASFRLIMVIADFPNLGIREVVHDGGSFATAYSGPGNMRQAITNGFHYEILRKGGWPSSPTIIPYAIDTGGSENT